MSLEIDNLSVGYRKRPVLRDISLSAIAEGSVVAVIGPNAVGKSTLLKALAGTLRHEGRLRLNGASLAELAHRIRAQRVGYLPQALPQASTLVAYEAIYSACRAIRGDLSAEHLRAAIESIFATLGIRNLALRRLSEMSGGQRQMIGLAQVLVRDPELLLLDEPTSALDMHWQLNVLNTVRERTRADGSIALVASHDINLASRFCDQLLVLSRGGLEAMGPPAEVLSSQMLRTVYGVEARIESCSLGQPLVLADQAVKGGHSLD
ncbi:ABC transporter ATP-binding protein [Aquisalimonas lutea]|uniref:ABC transporter ATP-binding protein n=1 Tax=Aquisalimonas lutea TaxID=1327750 RepID=UPI0025B3A14A|nr:ABC transporter ATP-binding protein [Aquisalimonas lutea]MDN3518500.1 ABC transporter ATP-binding protein [Aquisalimonas lutea]